MKILFLWMFFAVSIFAAAVEPPKIVSSSPKAWSRDVDPKQTNVSITFDQTMRPGFVDWFGRDTLSPTSTLHTTESPDHMTFSVDIKLQAAKVYVMGLNERGIPGVGFQTEKGFSLPRTYLVFQTAGAPSAEDAPPMVVRSIPTNGSQTDPLRTRSIVITFDKPMNPKKHGLHLYENEKAIDLSKTAFNYSSDGLTFTLPYAFRAGVAYRLELNSTSDIGFTRANRIPLWPVQIAFTAVQAR